MDVKVSFFLSDNKPPITLTLPDGAVLRQVREALEGNNGPLVVNGVARPDDYSISPTDTILSMPALEGG